MTSDSTAIGQQQALHQREEFTAALRALLMTPLMTPAHAEFTAVRRHAEALREWFVREAGWPLHIERDAARLYKRPADVRDASRGLPGYERRRYVLLCLACAVLERAAPQSPAPDGSPYANSGRESSDNYLQAGTRHHS